MGNGERGGREEQMALEQESAQQERVTKNGTSLRPADGPSEKWLARHFPPYRHSEGIGQQLGRFCVTLSSPPSLKSPALARSASRLRQGHTLPLWLPAPSALLWFTLMITTLLLTHHWSAPLGNNSVPDTKLNSTLHASPTVAIGHRRCSPFFELHNFGSGTPLTSVGTTPRQLLAQRGQLAHTFTAKIRQIFDVVLFRHAEHAKTFLRGFTPAILHHETFRHFRALRTASSTGDSEHEPMSSGHELWAHTSLAAARSLTCQ
jgi:hypothetical protein